MPRDPAGRSTLSQFTAAVEAAVDALTSEGRRPSGAAGGRGRGGRGGAGGGGAGGEGPLSLEQGGFRGYLARRVARDGVAQIGKTVALNPGAEALNAQTLGGDGRVAYMNALTSGVSKLPFVGAEAIGDTTMRESIESQGMGIIEEAVLGGRSPSGDTLFRFADNLRRQEARVPQTRQRFAEIVEQSVKEFGPKGGMTLEEARMKIHRMQEKHRERNQSR